MCHEIHLARALSTRPWTGLVGLTNPTMDDAVRCGFAVDSWGASLTFPNKSVGMVTEVWSLQHFSVEKHGERAEEWDRSMGIIALEAERSRLRSAWSHHSIK